MCVRCTWYLREKKKLTLLKARFMLPKFIKFRRHSAKYKVQRKIGKSAQSLKTTMPKKFKFTLYVIIKNDMNNLS